MEQKEFSENIISKIIERFPQFGRSGVFIPNDIVDIDYKSNLGKLIFRVSTQNNEITIGFAYDTKFDWHMHMSQFGTNTPDEELQVAISLIDKIINDKVKIVHSTLLGYFITDDMDGIYKYQEKDEIIETFYWSEL